MSVLDNWDQWKGFLADRMDQAKGAGISQNMITSFAAKVGDYLADNVDPKNEQERVLSDLWNVADENEQHTIANLMVKLVDNKSGIQ
ncbi:DUF3243 domain-containing protein [Terrilactibacillus sp. S3-3]|nr:DUF3243 domain-containing protein [Terrilactibacillus sp. S3-3]